MLIFFADPTKEICIIGAREDFGRLASLIRAAKGTMLSGQTGSPAPYDRLLGPIVIENKLGESVRFSVTQNGALLIVGDQSKLSILADNVFSISEADDSEGHWHVEYFPDHFFLAPDSFPVVFELTDAKRNQEFSSLQ